MVQLSAILPCFSGKVITHGHLRLRLLESLGSGAYGVVYRALDLNSPPHNSTYYAVKCLLRHDERSELFAMQQREIAHHKAVHNHPNIVKLHHIIEEDRFIFLLLDYCSGGDLFSAISDHCYFRRRDDRVRRTFLQIVDAVHHCHRKGIYHRDLKPENILCSGDLREVFLSDFGLSTTTRVSTAFGCGSSFYMSPECVGYASRGTPFVTASSDVWSLGVILTNMLTGKNPWSIACSIQDPAFISFSHDRNGYLERMLPMSPAARALLLRIFVADLNNRITLTELHQAILDIDTFFLSEEDELVFAIEEQLTHVDSVDITECVPADHLRSSEDDLELVEMGPLPSPFSEADANASVRAIFAPSRPTGLQTWDAARDSLFSAPSECSTESESGESEGPITPEQHAVVDVVSIPEFALESSAAPAPVDGECDISDMKPKKRKAALSWERVIGAVHKIKVL